MPTLAQSYFFSELGSENWLSGWIYRAEIIIDNRQNTSTLTDYQILVTVNTAGLISAGKMKSDCSDIRFTDGDGITLLDYWIEPMTINTSSTRIWVKVPTIPASSTKKIYMYYGNTLANGVSSGSSVFLLFNDWESNTLEGWNILNGGGSGTGSIVLLDGRYQLKLYAPNTSNRVQANKAFGCSNVGYAIETILKTGSSVGDGIGVGFSDGSMKSAADDAPNNGYVYYVARALNANDYIYRMAGGVGTSLASRSNSLATNTYYRVGFAWLSSNLRAFLNYTQVLNALDTTFTSLSYVFVSTDYYDKYFDWFAVRKYTYPEPIVNVGSEVKYIRPIDTM
jgi:hypothetical protein